MNKKDTERKHFKRRLLERYDIQINDMEYDFICGKIKNNDKNVVKFIQKQTNRVSIHLVIFNTNKIVVVYDKLRKSLVSALPPECEDVNKIIFYAYESDEV